MELQVTVHCDASSGISLAHRRGSAKTRHISTRFLWLHQKVHEKALQIPKVSGKENTADVGTKCVSEQEVTAALGTSQHEARDENNESLRCLERNRLDRIIEAEAHDTAVRVEAQSAANSFEQVETLDHE